MLPPNSLTRCTGRLRVIFQHMKMSSASSDEVILEKIGTKGVITLNRPKALNALNLSMIRKIYPVLKQWDADPSTSMVISKGTGDKAYCAGGDVKAIVDAALVGGSLAHDFFKEEYILNNQIGTLVVPYIALIDGVTMGGGVGLSVHGPFRVATERTVFAMPETAIGLFPDVGGGHFLPRLGGKLGIFLALTGFRLKGRDIQRAGVATHFVESDKVEKLEKDLLSLENASNHDIAVVIEKYERESKLDEDKEFVLQPYMDKINQLFDGQTMEEIFKNLEADGSEWATSQLNLLKTMSPMSMKVALRQILEGATKSLQENLITEYRISQRCIENKDFPEGVRAVLVDKDNKPKWQHSRLEECTDEKVATFFAPLPPERELEL